MKEAFDMVVMIHSIDKDAMDMVGRSIDDGSIKRVEDDLVKGTTIELTGGLSDNNYIYFPENIKEALDVTSSMKFINLTIRNIDKVFQFEYIVLDSNRMRRVFRFSTVFHTVRADKGIASIPLKLKPDWNNVSFNFDNLC
jgi:hypothetical protein